MTMTTSETEIGPTLAERDATMIGRLKATAAWLLMVLAATSFAAGVPGLLAVGGHAQLGGLSFLVPIIVDGGLVFFALSALSTRAETGKAAILPWFFVVLLTAASVASQVTHALAGAGWAFGPESIVGAAVASLFPLIVLGSTRVYESLKWGRAVDRMAKEAGRPVRAKARARSKPATAPVWATPVQSQPVQTGRPPARAGNAVAPEIRAEALARIEAGQPERRVAADMGVARSTLQTWRRAPAV